MTTEVLPMQSFDTHIGSRVQPSFGTSAEMTELYATPNVWGTNQPTNEFFSTNPYMTYPMPSFADPANAQSTFGTCNGSALSDAPTNVLSQPKLKTANMVAYEQTAQGPSPAQRSPGTIETSPASRKSSTVEPPYLDATRDDTRWTRSNFEQTVESPKIKPSRAGRKRKMEEAEPGSERAVYLEKNRQAASKCRTKQKRQQEDLVEQARQVQVRNKCLKAELSLLKDALRGFIEAAGCHQNCADSRLTVYIQREADRLAAGFLRTSATPFSPDCSTHTPFAPTVESSPEYPATSYD